jgi:hypothetical protein
VEQFLRKFFEKVVVRQLGILLSSAEYLISVSSVENTYLRMITEQIDQDSVSTYCLHLHESK